VRIFTIVGLAVLGVTLAVTVRSFRPELSLLIGVSTGIVVLLSVVGELTGVIDTLRTVAQQYGVDDGYLGVLLKIIGVAYLAQFGVQICRDAGESAPAAKVELAGRILILSAALPAAVAMLSAAAELLRRAAP
jgi:stage III sporulation protein AD